MQTSHFDFSLPEQLIATHPAEPRESARLLYCHPERRAEPGVEGSPDSGRSLDYARDDRYVRDLPSLLRPGDLLVFNDTKVIPARLSGKRGEAKVEVTLLKKVASGKSQVASECWTAFAKPAKKLRQGDIISFGSPLAGEQARPSPQDEGRGVGGKALDKKTPPDSATACSLAESALPQGEGEDFYATVMRKEITGEVVLGFNLSGAAFDQALAAYGAMPLPPYIRRAAGEADKRDYQTIYAAHPGAVAAPTAGLHFTPALMNALERHGIEKTFVTLHVGAGTFLPVKAEDTREHRMHSEWYSIGEEAARAITEAKKEGRRVVAVGTTSLRTLESAAGEQGRVHAGSADTDIFITPGYRFKCVDALLTNFHLPKSTLFMLVCAFAGTDRMKAAYDHAVAGGYRFYSYGDACLLEKGEG